MDDIETFPTKRLLTPVKLSMEHFFISNYTLNLYRGCNHGCIYCDSRSECYQIERFDDVRIKENALWMLRDELSRKRESGVVSMGAASDPYNRFEGKLKITREALKLLNSFGFGVGLSTKSALVARDADVLSDIGRKNPTVISFSITASDQKVARFIEPQASSTAARFAAMKTLAKHDVFTGTWLNPMLPFITDDEENMRNIIRRTKDSGGRYVICFFGVTLRTGDREYFYQALDRDPYYKTIKQKYVDTYGFDYECTTPDAKKLYDIYREECDKAGLFWNFTELNKAAMEKCPQQLSMF